MKRAFTLIEVLVVITILPVVMIVISGVYATFIRDIPRTIRVLQQNTTVLNLLEQVGRDMDQAVAVRVEDPRPQTPNPAGGMLLVERPGRVIRYEFRDGQVVRIVLTSDERGATSDGDSRLWRMPDAVVTWRPWIKDDVAYAVEIHSHVRQRVSGHLTRKLVGSHVFFVKGLGTELVSDH
jgi:prepilin-type N-terminal cleavage/methylation domain-containing protein